jgi:hypothetical protein
MFVSAHSLLPTAYGMWAWTCDVAEGLSIDSSCGNQAGYCGEVDVAEYAIGTPHDPRVRF